jgi:GntR family transcriptional regulator, transcriptional repressor for pyruvate dehydrogenase complex
MNVPISKVKFEPVLFSKASEYIERKIAESILDGRLKTGDRLPTEKEMARQFGVSLVTLREALRALEIFGLIEKRKGQGGGVFVSETNNESIKTALGYFLSFNYLSPQHLYEVREIIEPAMVKFAAQKITSAEIKQLERNIAYCEDRLKKAKFPFTKKEFFEIDKEHVNFHRLIAEGTHNPILSLTIDYVFDFLSICEKDLLIPDPQYSQNTLEEHKKILHHLKRKEGSKCEEEMVRHLAALGNYLQEIQRKPQNERISWALERSYRTRK